MNCKKNEYILRRNSDVSRGLINGALGTVVGFNYDIHNYINQILVQFDNSSKIITNTCRLFNK